MRASLEHGGAEIATFLAQNISGHARMAEAWQLHRVICQLHTNDLATARQRHVIHALPVVIGQVLGGLGGVGLKHLARAVGRAHGEHEAAAKGVCGAHDCAQIARLGDSLNADCEIASHEKGFSRDLLRRQTALYTQQRPLHEQRAFCSKDRPSLSER